MADISSEISAFQNAVYGEEVRGSMVSLAEKLNDVCEDCESTVDTMEAGYDAAMEAAGTATANANTAASSANGAASSATSAASSANTAANAANSAATNAISKANTADALSTSVQQAENARVAAESARASAEASRVTAENARAGSEANRQSAEQTRTENETARNSAEISRVSAEATRAANETARQSAESSRVSAESARATTFTAMQNSFADMEQQVLPPATYSTLGGVIIDEESGLEIDGDGVLSFEAGDFLTTTDAASTYATITTVNGKANASHVHAATDVTSGTLGASRGGTGVTTAAAERERLGLGSTTGALPIANGGTGATTASGALSAILDSNPLPVANGGTGSATASGALTNLGAASTTDLAAKADIDHTILGHHNVADPNNDYAVVLGNGTSDSAKSNAMTVGWDGEMRVYSSVMSKDRVPSVSEYTYMNSMYDADGNRRGFLQISDLATDYQGLALRAQRLVNGNTEFNGFNLAIAPDGTKVVSFNEPAAWRDALGTWYDHFTITRSDIDFTKADNNVSSNQYPHIKFTDQSNTKVGARFENVVQTDGKVGFFIYAKNFNTSGTDQGTKGIKLLMDKSGNTTYTVSDAANFCAALNVGNRVTKDQSTSVTVATSSYANICSVSLPAGTWAVFGCVSFPSNATNYRGAHLSTNSNAPNTTDERTWSTRVQACNGNSTILMVGGTCVYNSTTTLYLKGYQNSGSSLSCTGSITAVRIK